MGFSGKVILIILILLVFSCKSISTMEKNPFELQVNSLELWLDLMPKIESYSRLHLEIDFKLFNLTKEKIEIDSINFEVNMDSKYIYNFYSSSNEYRMLLPERFENYFIKSSIRNPFSSSISNNHSAKISANVYFKIKGKSFSKNILIGQKEIQVVY